MTFWAVEGYVRIVPRFSSGEPSSAPWPDPTQLIETEPMSDPVRKPQASLYDRDFYAWLIEQSRVLKARSAKALDWDNLAEEIDALGRSQRNEIRSRLIVLLVHLLKWEFQPDRRGHSWQSTIGEQRIQVEGVIEDSPSLESFPAEIFEACYGRARRLASQQTGLAQATFPESPPFSLLQALDPAFMPGRPWSADDLE